MDRNKQHPPVITDSHSDQMLRSPHGIQGRRHRVGQQRGKLLLMLFFLSAPFGGALQAQVYDGRACEEGNSTIKTLIKTGKVEGMTLHMGITGDADRWATSFLKAEGKPPESMPDYDYELDRDMDIHDWTCMFAAFRAFDQNQETAWSEGVKGPGVGEVLVVPLKSSKEPIRIRPGFALSDALFKANNRPRRIKVYALNSTGRDTTQVGLLFWDWTVLTSKEFELKDSNAWQTIQLPAHSPAKESVNFIAIEILSVYKGSKYDDTLISEVMN